MCVFVFVFVRVCVLSCVYYQLVSEGLGRLLGHLLVLDQVRLVAHQQLARVLVGVTVHLKGV